MDGQITRAGDLSDLVNVLSRDRDTFVVEDTAVEVEVEDSGGEGSSWIGSV